MLNKINSVIIVALIKLKGNLIVLSPWLLTHKRNVTVIAPDGATADWLATACSVLPVKKALKLCDSFPNTGLLIAEKKGTMLFKWQNSYFEKMME